MYLSKLLFLLHHSTLRCNRQFARINGKKNHHRVKVKQQWNGSGGRSKKKNIIAKKLALSTSNFSALYLNRHKCFNNSHKAAEWSHLFPLSRAGSLKTNPTPHRAKIALNFPPKKDPGGVAKIAPNIEGAPRIDLARVVLATVEIPVTSRDQWRNNTNGVRTIGQKNKIGA